LVSYGHQKTPGRAPCDAQPGCESLLNRPVRSDSQRSGRATTAATLLNKAKRARQKRRNAPEAGGVYLGDTRGGGGGGENRHHGRSYIAKVGPRLAIISRCKHSFHITITGSIVDPAHAIPREGTSLWRKKRNWGWNFSEVDAPCHHEVFGVGIQAHRDTRNRDRLCNVSSVNHRYGPDRSERSELRAGPYRLPG